MNEIDTVRTIVKDEGDGTLKNKSIDRTSHIALRIDSRVRSVVSNIRSRGIGNVIKKKDGSDHLVQRGLDSKIIDEVEINQIEISDNIVMMGKGTVKIQEQGAMKIRGDLLISVNTDFFRSKFWQRPPKAFLSKSGRWLKDVGKMITSDITSVATETLISQNSDKYASDVTSDLSVGDVGGLENGDDFLEKPIIDTVSQFLHSRARIRRAHLMARVDEK
eukprot:CAMPEP_0198258338 /NCGR_PEP_ID=MMETSP1447-20131203/7807_1 /TAXON_ID=420782 /ORGANISM="Chaetoceros dichaeta, Strain CCMP1751" /LENGTH=218 /DNA_ID=CAMNT_0043945445 /DNA_START=153 /DNA_END=809 /DNA_ORIENTATION=+